MTRSAILKDLEISNFVLGTQSVPKHNIFLQIYVRFVPDPMGSDAKNTLASKKLSKNVI